MSETFILGICVGMPVLFFSIFASFPFFLGRKVKDHFNAEQKITGSLLISRKNVQIEFSVPSYGRLGLSPCRLKMTVETPLSIQIFPAGGYHLSRPYMSFQDVLSIGDLTLQVQANDEGFIHWIKSGQVNDLLFLAFSSAGPVSTNFRPVFRIDKVGLVVGKFCFPKGEAAYLDGLPAEFRNYPHLIEKYIDTFLELTDKTLSWQSTDQTIQNTPNKAAGVAMANSGSETQKKMTTENQLTNILNILIGISISLMGLRAIRTHSWSSNARYSSIHDIATVRGPLANICGIILVVSGIVIFLAALKSYLFSRQR